MHLFDFFRRMLPFPPPEVPLTVDTDSLAKTVAKKILPTPTAKKTKPSPIATVPAQQFDDRSERNISTLHPEAQRVARVFLSAAINLAEQRGLVVRIISGLRTYAEQDALYAQGRTAPGQIVTKAQGGYSSHNFGLAWDIGIFTAKKYLESDPLYTDLGQLGESLGLEWGGRWKFRDEPHYQLRPRWAANLTEREMLTALRARVSQKKDLFA